MPVPKFVFEMSRSSLLTIHFVKEAYNSTLSHTKKEFRNTLARFEYVCDYNDEKSSENASTKPLDEFTLRFQHGGAGDGV